ncbi:SPOR domain-containing protein [Seohaeicola saemankumensis]|nr:SPOR domain-containing protein [Seohaeicola saemankumensis]MCA0872423.1 SPOR domain-containing protein [Seohaeicola saemankumensis]
MKVTRVIAVSVMLASLGLSALNAQTLRNSAPPAEFPPASYKGKQYVDSQGCIYIRAGIDGNVTWVPRVSRERKQICGYKPTLTAGAGATAQPAPTQQPTVITVAPTQQPAPKPAAKPAATPAPKPAPRTAAAPKPKPAPVVVSTAPAPKPATTRTTTKRPPAPSQTPTVVTTTAPRRTAAPVVAPRQAPAQGGCPNASAFSQQYINKTGVRCGPQTEPPVTYGQGWQKQSGVAAGSYPIDTRVVPRHVYENRQNTRNVTVPAGYKPVWKDDRLNPYRAERTLAPSAVTAQTHVPRGYQLVERDDDRMNLKRGLITAQGDAQTDAIWSRTLPRTLIPVAVDRPIVTVSEDTARSTAEARAPAYLRLSTRSVPGATLPKGLAASPVRQPEHQR